MKKDQKLLRTDFDEGNTEWQLRVCEPQSAHNVDDVDKVQVIYAASPDGTELKLWGMFYNSDDLSKKKAKRLLDELAAGYPCRGSEDKDFSSDRTDWASIRHADLFLGADSSLPDFDRDWQVPESLEHDLFSSGNGKYQSAENPLPPSHILQVNKPLIHSTGRLLKRTLTGLRYVGPVRDAIPRNYLPPRFPDARRWAGGLAAWDELTLGYNNFAIDVAGEWLNSGLKTGYYIVDECYREAPADDPINEPLEFEKLFEQLEVKRRVWLVNNQGLKLHPADVGQGITQAVPVIVAALLPFAAQYKDSVQGGLVALEQPELHLHPSAQVGLGDLFIVAIHDLTGHQLIIETHSEHLLLRILRRIRQTSEGKLPKMQGVRELGKGLEANQVAVNFFVPPMDDQPTKVYNLRIDNNGEFQDPWPSGFFDERSEELFGT